MSSLSSGSREDSLNNHRSTFTVLDVASRGSLKSPWSRRKRKHVLTPQLWKRFFTPEGKLYDGGARLLKKVRSGGVDPSIRHEVWPFLLGVYELNSSEDERNAVRKHKRKEYKKLRKRCQCLLKLCCESDNNMKEIDEIGHTSSLSSVSAGPDDAEYAEHHSSPTDQSDIDHTLHNEPSVSEGMTKGSQTGTSHISMEASHGTIENSQDVSEITNVDETESESSSSSEDTERASLPLSSSSLKGHAPKSSRTVEDFTTWQRIIRLDAVRANAEWVSHAPSQAAVSEEKARGLANAVGLRNYDHLEPCMVYHAARLVVVLEAYAIYDPTIGYCQGMSDLLSPIVSVMEEDCDAFWCFVGFMTKARHNFRLDEVGIRRQLGIVSKIIKFKDPHLYKHLEKLQAEDCFFVYRMVVVLFRRELSFDQTLCLWEVMWADQSAIRSGLGKSAWARIRLRAPPTDDLLLYAIAACVLQRRKLIIERYSSMDEILRECNNMAGRLDVWKLLDDAHDLVVTLHDKIS